MGPIDTIAAFVTLAAAAALSAACFSPSVKECAVTCSAASPCPSGASCLLDGFCHESAEESLCTGGSDAAPNDAGPMDAPLACGNGLVELAMSEECDDMNNVSGDGCSSTCAEETGFVCVEQPSQCRPNPSAAGELVVTEIMGNPSGPDFDKEWFEIHNPTATDFDLEGMIVSDDPEEFTVTGSLVLPAGGHVVLGQSTNLAINGGAPVNFGYANAIQLANGGSSDIELRFGDTVIDTVSILLPPDGTSRSLSAATYDHLANDDSANFCDGVDPYGDNGDLGTPGALNPACP